MSHLDPSTLAQYNSLVDPHLQSYFSNERIQSHLKHAGLISGRGEIIRDSEYRTRLARREHKRHVRHMLAENIVNRAIDIERARQAEMKRQFEMVSKAALVNNIKESRRHNGTSSGLMTNSADFALLSIDTSCVQTRPKSANYQNEISNEQTRITRAQSAHTDVDHRGKYPSKTRNRRRRRLQRSKNRSSSAQRLRSPSKYPSSSSRPCQITMVYYGPKLKVDYDHLVFEPIDEIMVMQQHCGGENIIVYKENLKPGAEFTFNSRRHSDYPFGLTFYVKGYIDSRISTCCEYKHRHGIRLGGKQGHFAIITVKGSKPCIKCRFEKQARLKKYAQSPKDKDDESKKPITIPFPVSDQPKMKQTPVEIPVRRTSISNDTYSEDFDGSDKQKQSIKDGNSSDSTVKRSHTNKRKTKSKDLTPKVPKRVSPIVRKEITRKLSSTSDETPKEKTTKKTWQIIFHTLNVPVGKNILVKFSFIANDKEDETETYEINIKQSNKSSKSEKQYPFLVKLNNIGKPEQIRLKSSITEDDEDDEDDIKWHLDYIELIDPETQSHSIFSCKQWIRLSQEKILQLSKKSPRDEHKRKSSSSTSDSSSSSSNSKTRQQSAKIEQKAKTSARSSTSSDTSKQSPKNRISFSNQSTPRNDQENKVRYRVTIYPSNDDNGEFKPNRNSRIFLRLNNEIKETNLTRKIDQLCPTFESGEKQSFEIDLIQQNNEKAKKLTIGYVNSNDKATKWKLEKIILLNIKTGDEIIFSCKQILNRNETNFHAEKTFEIQSSESDNDESTPRNEKINSPKFDHEEQIPTPKKQQSNANNKQRSPSIQSINHDQEQIKTSGKQQTNDNNKQKRLSFQNMNDNEEQIKTPTKQQMNANNKQRSPSIHSMNDGEEQIKTSGKQQTHDNNKQKPPSVQKLNDNEEQIHTPKKQQINTNNKQRSPSIQSMNNDEEQIKTSEKQQPNGYTKQKSPSFQSMNDDEADYREIFKQLDPTNKLKLGSPRNSPTPQNSPTPRSSPTSRPKTRRGRQDQTEEQYTNQPVDPLVGLDDLADQTARSNDQQNQSSLPSTTTDNAETQFKKWYTNNDDDDEDN